MEWREGKKKYGGIAGPRKRWQECVGYYQTTTTDYYERKIKFIMMEVQRKVNG